MPKEIIAATPNRQLQMIDFGDVLTLLFWCLLISSIVITIYGLTRKSGLLILISSFLMGLAAFLGMWSVGVVLSIISVIQLVVAVCIYVFRKKWR